MARNEMNANEELTTGVVVIQILLAMGTCLLTLAYRISVKRLIKQPPKPPAPWPHIGSTNPQSHCCELFNKPIDLAVAFQWNREDVR